jgi:hypothetical protein
MFFAIEEKDFVETKSVGQLGYKMNQRSYYLPMLLRAKGACFFVVIRSNTEDKPV